MIEDNVGVAPAKTYTLKRMDQDYFEILSGLIVFGICFVAPRGWRAATRLELVCTDRHLREGNRGSMATSEDDDDILSEIEMYMEEELRKERPDYRNTVYCDWHLGVRMVLAESWSSVECGDASVNLNPTVLWYCPKPGCRRYFEPTMVGYHINEPGRRLQTDGPKQPRGNHPGIPFMYIGKFGGAGDDVRDPPGSHNAAWIALVQVGGTRPESLSRRDEVTAAAKLATF